jgi:hypothetical protein
LLKTDELETIHFGFIHLASASESENKNDELPMGDDDADVSLMPVSFSLTFGEFSSNLIDEGNFF